MSAEHGHGHHAETATDMITTIFLALLLIPAVTAPVEEAVQSVFGPEMGHGGGQH